jgi:ABC-type multidrug transport system permease subunit
MLAVVLENPWIALTAFAFVALILYFIIKFFSVFFEFVQAKGCLTVGLVTLIGLPGLITLCIVTGYNSMSIIIIVLSLIGVVTGYIARDSEGDVGKFGIFVMVVSVITLITAVVFRGYLQFYQ